MVAEPNRAKAKAPCEDPNAKPALTWYSKRGFPPITAEIEDD